MNIHDIEVIEFEDSDFKLLKQLVESERCFDYRIMLGRFVALKIRTLIEDINTHLELDRFLYNNETSSQKIESEYPNLHFLQLIIEHDFIKPCNFDNLRGGSFIAVRNDKHLVDFLEENIANLNLRYKCNISKMSDMLFEMYIGLNRKGETK